MNQVKIFIGMIGVFFFTASCSTYFYKSLERDAAGKPYNHEKKECLKTALYAADVPLTVGRTILVFEIKNTCKSSQTVVLQQTPFEIDTFPFTTDRLFEVRDNQGRVIKYRGPLAHIGETLWLRGDYFELPVGRTIFSAFNLCDGYKLTPGKYKIRYVGPASSNLSESEFLEFEVVAKP